IILQNLTQLADRTPDTVVGIQKNAAAPNPGNDLIPGDNFVAVFKQKEKNLEGDTLQLQNTSTAPQPPEAKINLVAFGEPNRQVHPTLVGRHSTHPMK